MTTALTAPRLPRYHLWIAGAFLLAVVVRMSWFVLQVSQPSSDDLLYAMMADAIRSGRDFPLLMWRAGYGGTLGTSWVLALLFRFFGTSLGVALGYGALLSLVQVWIWSRVADAVHPGAGIWTALLLAVPPPTLGLQAQTLGYAEPLTIGALWIWSIVRAIRRGRASAWHAWWIGALAGYLVYIHPIVLVFLPAALALRRFRVSIRPWYAASGFCVGLAPLVIANAHLGGVTVRRIGGRVLGMTAAEFTQHASLQTVGHQLLQQIRAGFFTQPRLLVEACSWETGGVVFGVLTAACFLFILMRSGRAPALARWVAWPVMIAMVLGNILLGRNAHARYYLSAHAAGSLLAGVTVGSAAPTLGWAVYGLALLNEWQTIQVIQRAGLPPPYDAAMAYLNAQHLRYGYADFWTAIPLTFLSRGRLVVSTTGMDPERFYDRTVSITQQVDAADTVFYLYRRDRPAEQRFAHALEQVARADGMLVQQCEIGPFTVYSGFSRPIRPQEFGMASLDQVAAGRND